MLTIQSGARIFVAIDPIDFRCGIKGVVRIVEKLFEEDPTSGVIFVFRNQKANSIKVLVHDGTGFWLCYKKLSTGQLNWWPTSTSANSETGARIEASQFLSLIKGGFDSKISSYDRSSVSLALNNSYSNHKLSASS